MGANPAPPPNSPRQAVIMGTNISQLPNPARTPTEFPLEEREEMGTLELDVKVLRMKKKQMVSTSSSERAKLNFYHETFYCYRYFDRRQRCDYGNVSPSQRS